MTRNRQLGHNTRPLSAAGDAAVPEHLQAVSATGTQVTQAAIVLKGLTKSYPLFASLKERIAATLFGRGRLVPDVHIAVEDVTLTVAPGETLGILGVNGAGKSTLLQLITGVLTPTSGTVVVNGQISALLELGAGFDPNLTGRQNAEFQCRLNNVPSDQIEATLTDIEAFADIGYFFDQPMRVYSSGMYVRVAFAAAISVDPDILIVDEALAVGDARFQAKCFARFREFQDKGKTILLVTHGPDLVAKYCSRAIVMDRGKLDFAGEPAAAINHFMMIMYGATKSQVTELENADGTVVSTQQLQQQDLALMVPKGALFDPADQTDKLSARPFFNLNEHRYGHGGARIVDAYFADDAINLTGHCESSTRVTIIMRITATKDMPSVTSGIVLKTVDGLRVYGTSGVMLGYKTFKLAAGQDVQITTTLDLSLFSGDYFFDLAISEYFDGIYNVIDCRQSVIQLLITSSYRFNGITDLRAEMGSPTTFNVARIADFGNR